MHRYQKTGWTDLLRVTDLSMKIHISRAINEWKGKVECARRKYTKRDMEEGSELAALVAAMYVDITSKTNLKAQDVYDAFVEQYISGACPEIDIELSSILMESRRKSTMNASPRSRC